MWPAAIELDSPGLRFIDFSMNLHKEANPQ